MFVDIAVLLLAMSLRGHRGRTPLIRSRPPPSVDRVVAPPPAQRSALEKFHHRHIHPQVNRDPVLQLDRHQGVQSQIAQRLLYVQPGGGNAEYTSHLLSQVGLQQPVALRRLRGKERIPLFSRMTRLRGDWGLARRASSDRSGGSLPAK